MHTIRAFDYSDSDYQAIADLFATVSGNNHHNPETIRHMDKIRGAEIPSGRFVAEKNTQVIAEGSFSPSIWFATTDKLHLHITIHPEHESDELRKAIAARLIEQAVRYASQSFVVRVYEDESESIQFWKDQGFRQIRQEPRFALDLRKFAPAGFKITMPDLQSQEIEIHSLAELKSSDPDWLKRWWQMVLLKEECRKVLEI